MQGFTVNVNRTKTRLRLLGCVGQQRDEHVEQHDGDHKQEEAQQRRRRDREVGVQVGVGLVVARRGDGEHREDAAAQRTVLLLPGTTPHNLAKAW